MRVLRLRFILLLSVVYLGLVFILYHFLWRMHALDKFFDTPGQHGPQTSNEFVLFNFKRRGGPHMYSEQNASLIVNQSVQQIPFVGEHNSLHLILPPPFGKSSERQLQPEGIDITGAGNTSNLTRTIDKLPNFCLHAFYYMWYGNEASDGQYFHWNHRYLPHWKDSITKRFPTGRHIPPHDIGTSFYPKLGTYSSKDRHTMEAHMKQMRAARIGVISVSWYPPGLADSEGFPTDPLIPLLLDIAEKHAIKVTVLIEPYENRSALTVTKDMKYIYKHYFNHPAFYKHRSVDRYGHARLLPLIYIYDSYLTPVSEWRQVLKPGTKGSIRQSKHDFVAIALLVQETDKRFILEAGFDGFFTYFASVGFSYGSTTAKWSQLAKFAKQQDLLFIPSFGPGYDDTRVRPWNSKNSKGRKDGRYYREMFQAALRANHGGILSLTSFNEWHEGTQIEPAVLKSGQGITYLDYSPHSPEYYLQLTSELSQQLQCV